MNDNELTKQELASLDIPIEAIIDEYKAEAPIYIPDEIPIYLHDNFSLLGLYFILRFLAKRGLLLFRKQDQLASLLGISRHSWISKRNELEKLGLIKIEKRESGRYSITFFSLKKLERFKLPKDFNEASKFLDKMQSKISPMTVSDYQEVARQQTLLEVDEKVEAKVKEIKQKEVAKKKAEEKRFPNDEYAIVITGYMRVKGIKLVGPELLRAKRAIKQMFLAGHKPYDIIKCMEFFKKQAVLDENMWMRTWTLETIMKKIPEFKAGKLSVVESMEEQYETIVVPRR